MKNTIWKEAQALQSALVAHRRYLHEHAERGFALEKTLSYVRDRLENMGYKPQNCGRAGLVATVGDEKGKCFLLRADMDGLPIRENSGEAFACKTGNMHACGHDMHTAMLLGAAQLLKSHEDALTGCVKLLFQPAEELLEGAKDMLQNGVLTDPSANGGMMLHVMTDVPFPTGTAIVASKGVSAPAADFFRITVQGKSCHGSAPWNGVDALTAAAHILIALQELSAREISLAAPAVLTVGALQAGEAGNVIADTALLKGTLRAFDEETRAQVKKRMGEIVKNVAKAFRAKAKIVYEGGCPTLLNDGVLSAFALQTAKELLGDKKAFFSAELGGGGVAQKNGGSEDFAYISHEIPTVMLALAAGQTEKGYRYPLHHPKTRFDENALCMGAALYAQIAIKWLKKG